ncbi:MAG: metallophosphoesterase family protein [Planctomycetota bacterium]|jgi:Icc-related predicted phosphoesterase
MRILYATDLHGVRAKYERVLEAARERRVDVVVNGGDMYPKDGPLERQHEFISGFLDRHFADYARSLLPLLCMPGNDDLAGFDPLFDEACARHAGVTNIAQRKVELGGSEFIGLNSVVDCPFGLKDRCHMDSRSYRFQEQISPAVISDGEWPEFRGLKPLGDWFAEARSRPTLEDELSSLARPRTPERAVYVIHMPPAGLGLDVCLDGRLVGSEAVRAFLLDAQPLLSLHGHIHESPRVSGAWRGQVGRTVAVQPGQEGRLAYVVADLESMEVERVVER